MAKRSLRHHVRYEKDQMGCIWGLISIFNFRHGRSTPKLLSDWRRGNRDAVGSGYPRTKGKMLKNFEEKCQSIEDGEESETETADTMKTSVKDLMEEEMFNEEGLKKQTASAEIGMKQCDSEHGGHVKRKHKRTNTVSSKPCDLHTFDLDAAKNLGSENSRHQVTEEKNSNNLDLKIIMEELCHQIKSTSCVKHDWHDDLDVQSNQTCSVFEEKISAAVKVVIDHRFTNGEHLREDVKTHHSKEFMDALQTLSLNKDLFLKSLEDPNSPLVKHIQDFEDARLKKHQKSNSFAGSNLLEVELSKSGPDKLVNHKRHNFFRRKIKSQETNPFKGNETCRPSSRIVILKPGSGGLRNSDAEINASTSMQSYCTTENKAQSDRNASQFSFTEIKRKLKHAIGKERRGISPDGTAHRFPYEHQNLGDGEKGAGGESSGWSSPNRNHFFTERFAKPSIGVKRGEKIGKSKDSDTGMVNEITGYSTQRVSNIYIEAKKHLIEMVSNGDEDAELMSRQLPKTLGRILSLPDYNFSPSCSPGKDRVHSSVTTQMRFSPPSNFQMVNENGQHLRQENHAVLLSPPRQNFESESCIPNCNSDEKIQSLDSNPDVSCDLDRNKSVQETQSFARDEMSSEEVEEIVKTSIWNQKDSKLLDVSGEPDSKLLDVSGEPNSSSITEDAQICDPAEVCDEESSSQCVKLDSIDEEDQLLSSPLASPSNGSVIAKVENLETTIYRTEASPISVLVPLFTEDDVSPASTTSRSVQSAIQPQQIHFEEPVSSATDQGICIRTSMENEESAFEYVEAVLLGSDLNWDEFLLRWLSSDQILNPSLFDEVELFTNRSCHDQKLLFDCTNEVLEELCERYFGCFPGMPFVKQNIRPVPKRMDLICEVWDGVEWHLLQQSLPSSLDQLVRKDMAKSRTWMDLRLDTEHIVIEMGEAIFGELMEETILSFVNDSPET